jgi:hypothetical protein
MKFKTGDVVFVMHNKNFISKLFASVMGSEWSHSAVVYGELNGEDILLETNDYCVNLNYIKRYIEDKNCSIEVLSRPRQLAIEEIAQLRQQGRPLIGSLYGYLQLISLALRRLFKLKTHNFFRQGLVCCHVIGYCYKGIDSPLKTLDPESFDTQELYEMLVLGGWETVYKKGVE